MQRWPFILAVALLFLTGLGIATYRYLDTGMPPLPGQEQTVWQIEARIRFTANGSEAEALLTLPPDQSGFEVLSETGASPGFGFAIDRAGPQRRAHWTKRTVEGRQTLFYKLDLVQDSGRRVTEEKPRRRRAASFDGAYATAANEVLSALRPKSANPRSLTEQLIQEINTEPLDQNMSLLLQRYSPVRLTGALLSQAEVTARTVKALRLRDGRRRQRLRDYLQVWDDDGWLLFDPKRGLVEDTAHILVWQTGNPAVLEVIGGTRSRVTFSMVSQTHPALGLARERYNPFDLSLQSLPIAEQGMFKLIMTLPVGALVVVLMRLFVGVPTSGTFMPVLIALAFLQTELLAGLIGLVLVVGAGLLLRFYLSALNLLLVARIATIVVLVIALVTVLAVVSYRLGLISGLAITFFPMVILAWTVERMSILWEEEGPLEALIQGAGSLLVAVLAYLVMNLAAVRHLAFNFPELHLCVLAAILLLGRYTGYRLLELHRFTPFLKRSS